MVLEGKSQSWHGGGGVAAGGGNTAIEQDNESSYFNHKHQAKRDN